MKMIACGISAKLATGSPCILESRKARSARSSFDPVIRRAPKKMLGRFSGWRIIVCFPSLIFKVFLSVCKTLGENVADKAMIGVPP